jgi:hypothetical protein
MAGYKGQGGSAQWGDVAIAQVKSWAFEWPTVPTFDWAVKGDNVATVEIGTANYGTATVVGVFDYAVAQSTLIDLLDAASLATHAASDLDLYVESTHYLAQNCVLTGAAITSPEGDAMTEITFTFRVTGDTVMTGWA